MLSLSDTVKAGSHLCDATHCFADTSEIHQGMRHGVARCVAAKVSCFKMDRVVSVALLCEVFIIG